MFGKFLIQKGESCVVCGQHPLELTTELVLFNRTRSTVPNRNLSGALFAITCMFISRSLERGDCFNMRGGLALFAADPAVLLNPTAPPLVGFLAPGGNVILTRSRWACGGRSNVTPSPGHPHRRPGPHPATERLYMENFSSSAYWNKVYTSGIDDSGQEAVVEWHVEGEVMANAVERLVGDPASGGEELTLLNIGCGKSTLWER